MVQAHLFLGRFMIFWGGLRIVSPSFEYFLMLWSSCCVYSRLQIEEGTIGYTITLSITKNLHDWGLPCKQLCFGVLLIFRM